MCVLTGHVGNTLQFGGGDTIPLPSWLTCDSTHESGKLRVYGLRPDGKRYGLFIDIGATPFRVMEVLSMVVAKTRPAA